MPKKRRKKQQQARAVPTARVVVPPGVVAPDLVGRLDLTARMTSGPALEARRAVFRAIQAVEGEPK